MADQEHDVAALTDLPDGGMQRGNPKRIDLPGGTLHNVFLLRSRLNADAILAQAERSTAAVVLGAGFIGMGVAASLRERGLDLTGVGTGSAPFEKRQGPRIGSAFTRLHERRGVAFRLGDRGPDDGAVPAVRMAGGEQIAAALVILGSASCRRRDICQE
jgi:apoptosis-inducing factor 3